MREKIALIVISYLAVFGAACTSTPSTQYYTLVPQENETTQSHALNNNIAIGIGPLVMPDILDNFSVVSIENGNKILLSAYHLWGGNLKENINQVLADNISNNLNINSVWPFPWDNRNRPEIQVRIVIERFIGELGKQISLQAKWTLLANYGRKELVTYKYKHSETLQSSSYLSYVKHLNIALNNLSLEISEKISQFDSSSASLE